MRYYIGWHTTNMGNLKTNKIQYNNFLRHLIYFTLMQISSQERCWCLDISISTSYCKLSFTEIIARSLHALHIQGLLRLYVRMLLPMYIIMWNEIHRIYYSWICYSAAMYASYSRGKCWERYWRCRFLSQLAILQNKSKIQYINTKHKEKMQNFDAEVVLWHFVKHFLSYLSRHRYLLYL